MYDTDNTQRVYEQNMSRANSDASTRATIGQPIMSVANEQAYECNEYVRSALARSEYEVRSMEC
jgi:hypothetical protein